MRHGNDAEDRRLVRQFVGLTFIVAVASFVFGAVYVNQMLVRGFSPQSMGIAFFFAFALSTVAEVVSGDWGDRYGQRRMTVTGLVLWGVGLISFAYVSSVAGLVASLVCWSLGQAFYSGAALSLTVNAIPSDSSALRESVVRRGQISRWVGAVLGGLVVLLGARPQGLPALIAGAGVVLCLSALYVHLRWTDGRVEAGSREARLVGRIRSAWTSDLNSLLLASVASLGLLSIFLFAWQPTATSVLKLADSWLGAVLLLLTALAAAGSWCARFVSSALSRGNTDLWVLTATTGALLCTMALSPVTAIVAFVGVEVMTSYVLTVAATRAHSAFPDAARNLLWSTFGAIMGAAMAIVDLVFGLGWQQLGLSGGLLSAVAVLAPLCLIIGFAVRWMTGRDDDASLT